MDSATRNFIQKYSVANVDHVSSNDELRSIIDGYLLAKL